MSIDFKIFDTETLLGVFFDTQNLGPVETYFFDMFTGLNVSDNEYVEFNRVGGNRKLAPYVMPTAMGKPIYSAAESVTRMKPGYIKIKDPVSASHVLKRRAGFGEMGNSQPMTPGRRYLMIVADIVKQHRDAITRTWEKQASDALRTGSITLKGDDYPERVVNFQRSSDHDVVLTGAAQWSSTSDILSSIQTYVTRCRRAKWGGPVTRLTVGADVLDVLLKNEGVREMLKNDSFRNPSNGGMELNLGLREGQFVERIGRLGSNLELYSYSDYYEDENGDPIEFLGKNEALFTGPNIQGIKCYGAISDLRAQLQAMPVFMKMWESDDPSATLIMSQSAPLMAPVRPDSTLRLRPLGAV